MVVDEMPLTGDQIRREIATEYEKLQRNAGEYQERVRRACIMVRPLLKRGSHERAAIDDLLIEPLRFR